MMMTRKRTWSEWQNLRALKQQPFRCDQEKESRKKKRTVLACARATNDDAPVLAEQEDDELLQAQIESVRELSLREIAFLDNTTEKDKRLPDEVVGLDPLEENLLTPRA